MRKMVKILSFVLITITLIMDQESWALENCWQEQTRLRAQVHQLETRVKHQQVMMAQLLHEKEIQFLDKVEEISVVDLGGKRQYAGWSLSQHSGKPENYSYHPFKCSVCQNGQQDVLTSPEFVYCSEIFNDGFQRSGFYKIKPLQSPAEFSVYCDMSDGGGWTVIQRRSDGSENFNRGWTDYESGFGNFVQKDGEYWLGNKNIHLLTLQGDYTLKIDLADFERNSRFAQYDSFKVGNKESFYELNIGEYSGTAGDSLSGKFHPEVQWWASHQRMKFSTWDKDNDNYNGNCAQEDQSGWWFNRCHSANLNGVYYGGPYTAETDSGVVWYTWHGWWYSLKSVVMKIRPNDFIPNIVS